MNCPACSRPLKELPAGPLLVDGCHGGCGGVWFDNHELQKVDEQHELAGEALLDLPASPDARADAARPRTCPRCPDQPLRRHCFSFKRRVQVDCCPACGGYWLDAGELAGIRAEFPTENDRQLATKEFVAEVSQWQLAGAARAEERLSAERGRGFGALLRLLGRRCRP